jgi:hypothetical protein
LPKGILQVCEEAHDVRDVIRPKMFRVCRPIGAMARWFGDFGLLDKLAVRSALEPPRLLGITLRA